MLVIADRGFPYWPAIETIDLSLVDDIPRVLEVLRAIRANFSIGRAFMANEFKAANTPDTLLEFETVLQGIPVTLEPHDIFKQRVPAAIGLIRTGDTIQYANIILQSA